jgi:uncharacterized membrane protein
MSFLENIKINITRTELVVSFVIFLILDVIFIYLNRNNFINIITKIQGKEPKMDIPSAIITYFFLYLGLFYFILNQKKSVFDAFILGIVIYGVFEFTTRTVFKDWTLYTAVIDTIWGGVLFASTTYFTKIISTRIL